ncbi:hypothetical protein [Microvirga sp. TS319]|uniref:hypothetical protein n=1 Tax=Microvirga sp. TS319 TaxID=3241165 RepID=UPI00351A0F15
MPSVLALLSLLVPLLAGTPAAAQPAQAPDHNAIDCYCRAQGRMVPQGETVCLKTADGPRLAQCRMEINVMSWNITSTPCPEA